MEASRTQPHEDFRRCCRARLNALLAPAQHLRCKDMTTMIVSASHGSVGAKNMPPQTSVLTVPHPPVPGKLPSNSVTDSMNNPLA